MTGARVSTLTSLRDAIRHLEAQTMPQQVERVALGHADVDATLQGGLLRGTLHEVFATETRQSASATGFAAGLVQRLANHRPMLWVQQGRLRALKPAQRFYDLSLSWVTRKGRRPNLVLESFLESLAATR